MTPYSPARLARHIMRAAPDGAPTGRRDDTRAGTGTRARLGSVSLAGAFALLAACGGETASVEPLLTEIAPAGWVEAAGKLNGPDGTEMGVVAFNEGPSGVLMRVDVTGLTPGWHGIHLHQVADCSDGDAGFKASGGHVNPDGVSHGLLNDDGAHRADIVNIYAGNDGRASAEIYRADVHLFPSEASAADNGPYPLIDDDGFAVIIHENADDHVAQPIGGAGGRVACAAVKAG